MALSTIHRAGIVAVLIGISAACGSFGGSDQDSPGTDSGSSADSDGGGTTSSDASVVIVMEGGSAAGDASPMFDGSNLLVNGDFESMSTCGAWSLANSEGGTLTRLDGGHGGKFSCRVCGNGNEWYLIQKVTRSMKSGEGYTASAYFEKSEVFTVANLRFQINANTLVGDVTNVPVPNAWAAFEAGIVIPEAGAPFMTVNSTTSSGSGCFDIDDVALVRTQ